VRIVLVAVGKIREPGLRAAVDDYAQRIGRYARVEEVELKDGPEADLIPRFRKQMGERARVVALEVGGARKSSQGFAEYLGRAEADGVTAVVFLIGGAFGLPAEVSRAAALRLSLSDMILPHRLARLFLVEQIYRAFTILRGEPYSH
jgi:23S rRNA (pseudouridine1915-N3)-methyltransferase